jgi:hypothetical protein
MVVRFARGLSILFVFSKTIFLFSWFFVDFFCCCFYFINLGTYFYYFSLVLGFACSCFSRSLRCRIMSLIWDLSDLLIYALMVINFPLRIDFAAPYMFW